MVFKKRQSIQRRMEMNREINLVHLGKRQKMKLKKRQTTQRRMEMNGGISMIHIVKDENQETLNYTAAYGVIPGNERDPPSKDANDGVQEK